MDRPVFVDADVFLSFLVRDREEFYEKAMRLFELAEGGRLKLQTTALAIAEVVRALQSRYGLGREEIREILEAILSTRNLKVSNRPFVKAAADIYARGGMGFTDAYNAAYVISKGPMPVATFRAGRLGGAEGMEFFWKGGGR
jgi:predicted nucleic acid-binding protein